LRNELGRSRLGVTVTRKFGGAVLRNRSKRIVRDIFRRNRSAFGVSCDFVVNVRSGALTRPHVELERELKGLAARLVRIAT
jgi:ribonuclease P protein component